MFSGIGRSCAVLPSFGFPAAGASVAASAMPGAAAGLPTMADTVGTFAAKPDADLDRAIG